jgi:23S rRNA U2552 (ribose-2'-O)-methylase RlmE/FtsJ
MTWETTVDVHFLRFLASDMENTKIPEVQNLRNRAAVRLREIADKLETLEQGYMVIKDKHDGLSSR